MTIAPSLGSIDARADQAHRRSRKNATITLMTMIATTPPAKSTVCDENPMKNRPHRISRPMFARLSAVPSWFATSSSSVAATSNGPGVWRLAPLQLPCLREVSIGSLSGLSWNFSTVPMIDQDRIDCRSRAKRVPLLACGSLDRQNSNRKATSEAVMGVYLISDIS